MTGVEIFFFSWAVGFSGAIMPGPLLTFNIKETLKRGFWAGPQLVLGHALLEGLLLLGLVLGLGNLLELEISKGIISVLGGAFLLWTAWGMLRYEGKEDLLAPESPGRGAGMPPVIAGAAISLANPYWSVWWATLGLGFLIQAQKMGVTGILLFYSGHILADFMWYTAVSLVVAGGKKAITPKLYRGVIIVCGLFLVYLALDFLRLGVETLDVMGWFLREK